MGDGKSITLSASLLNLIANFNTLEEAVMELARNIMVAVLQALDDELLNRRPKGYICVGKRTRSISTRIGDIVICRRLYRKATAKANRGVFLLDKALGIQPRRRVSGGLLKLLVSLATRLPFREVADVLEEAGFPVISHSTIHKEVRRYGELQAQLLRRGVALMFGMGEMPESEENLRKVPILFIEADGVMVGCQRDPQKRRKQEIKLVTSYEGWEEKGKRRQLENPTVLISNLEKDERIWELFSLCLAKQYDLSDTVIVVNGDGAAWIQETVKEYFPNAIVQLDRFHLIRDLIVVVGEKTARELLEQLNLGKVDVFMDTLEALEPQIPKKKRSQYKKLLSMCQRYREHLLDYRHRINAPNLDKKLYGMGVAETMVDKKVANRMKKRGMAWSPAGAMAMSSLLMLRANGQLFLWLDEHIEDDMQNPVREYQKRIKATGQEHGEWLQVRMPALEQPTKPWIKALRGLAAISMAS